MLLWFRIVTELVELAGAVLGYWIHFRQGREHFYWELQGIVGILTYIRMKDSFKDTAMISPLGG